MGKVKTVEILNRYDRRLAIRTKFLQRIDRLVEAHHDIILSFLCNPDLPICYLELYNHIRRLGTIGSFIVMRTVEGAVCDKIVSSKLIRYHTPGNYVSREILHQTTKDRPWINTLVLDAMWFYLHSENSYSAYLASIGKVKFWTPTTVTK